MARTEDSLRIDDAEDLKNRIVEGVRAEINSARSVGGTNSPIATGDVDQPLHVVIKSIYKTVKPQANLAFIDTLEDGRTELAKLLDNPPTLTGKATEDTDGRRIPLVLAVVRDKKGATRAGIELRLIDKVSKVLLDHSRTDTNGVVVLRFPRRTGDNDAAEGTIELSGGNDQAVLVPAGVQHVVTFIELPKLPDLPEVIDPETGEAKVEVPLGDDPFERLPADFSPALADAIVRLRGTVPDPILGKVAAPDDFRSSRTPLIKRLTIPRIGEVPTGNGAPRRYLVRVRQEWTFLGYTLGELAGVDSLDPGTIIEEASSTVQRTVEQASTTADRFTSEALDVVRSSLSQASSIDSLLSVATSARTSTEAVGFGSIGASASFGGGIIGGAVGAALGPIGGLVGGLFGGGSAGVGIGGEVGTRTGTSVLTSTTTTSRTNTSLQVNSLLHTAKSVINQTLRTATSMLRNIQSTISREVGRVSPLLSRVTNLLRWTLYENYAVVTHVEDVVEIKSVRIIEPVEDRSEPLFDAEEIAEYRRFFEPALLEPLLRPHFHVLREAIELQKSGGPPITSLHFAFDYSAALFGASLRVSIGDYERTIYLQPGQSIARTTVYIPPTLASELGSATLHMNAHLSWSPRQGSIIDRWLDSGGVTVSQMRVWFNRSTGGGHQTTDLSAFSVSNDSRSASATHGLLPVLPEVDLSKNPLFRHINRNRTYYFGILAQAALEIPSLRDDAPQLDDFHGDHALWRLPIVGFEGDRVLVISDVDKTDKDAARLLEDTGAATIVQLAAPGAYSEALQGLLSLTDAVGKIHPALEPPPAPAVPPLGLIDLTGKTLEVVEPDTPVAPIG